MKWYYDLTEDHRHSGDPESLLVWLCDDCAAWLLSRQAMQFAGADGFNDSPCWRCGRSQKDDE
jgi:hypothetical protein